MRHGGQILIDQLKIQDVDRVFCLPGESYLAALDGLFESGVETIIGRQEGGVGDDGRSAWQVNRQAGRGLCDAGARAQQMHPLGCISRCKIARR